MPSLEYLDPSGRVGGFISVSLRARVNIGLRTVAFAAASAFRLPVATMVVALNVGVVGEPNLLLFCWAQAYKGGRETPHLPYHLWKINSWPQFHEKESWLCPYLTASFGKAGPAPHLGCRVELALGVMVSGKLAPSA